jgi:DNA-directed RNA polymerase specialized sigma54-like protein
LILYGIIIIQMVSQRTDLAQTMQPGLRQIVRMQQADLLQLSDKDFRDLIAEVEGSPLFRRFFRKEKIIRYRRYPGTDVSARFYQVDTETLADSGSADIESLLENRDKLVGQIRKLGIEKFKRYFLLAEGGITPEDTAAACGLSIREVDAINSLVNEFDAVSEFYHPSQFSSGTIHYTMLAAIEMGRGGFSIQYFSPNYARGRYEIDYNRYEQFLGESTFSAGEKKQVRRMLQKLELINARKDTINKILQSIVKKQARYLETGEKKALLPFTQKELAGETGLAASSVSRALRYKSVRTPRDEEVPLKDFLPGPKQFKKQIIRQLLLNESGITSDKVACDRLTEKYGISISRRSVAKLRQELKLPGRGKAVKTGGVR